MSKDKTEKITAGLPPLSQEDSERVALFLSSCDDFPQAVFTFNRGLTETTKNADGTDKIKKIKEIGIRASRKHPAPEIGAVVLVTHSSNGIMLFQLTEQHDDYTDKQTARLYHCYSGVRYVAEEEED